MAHAVQFEMELPGDLARLQLPDGLQRRLQVLLDKQDDGSPLSDTERSEAEGLVDMADFMSLLRHRAGLATGRS